MSDIELVVKIPKEVKNRLCFGVTYAEDIQTVCEALQNGTPLPRGHGKIIDVNNLLEEMRATRTYDIPFALEHIKPIIEADKG